jgi:hypothetical protein
LWLLMLVWAVGNGVEQAAGGVGGQCVQVGVAGGVEIDAVFSSYAEIGQQVWASTDQQAQSTVRVVGQGMQQAPGEILGVSGLVEGIDEHRERCRSSGELVQQLTDLLGVHVGGCGDSLEHLVGGEVLGVDDDIDRAGCWDGGRRQVEPVPGHRDSTLGVGQRGDQAQDRGLA